MVSSWWRFLVDIEITPPQTVFVKVVEASRSYAAGSAGSGGLIQAQCGRARNLGGFELLKRAGFVALAMVRVAKRSVAPHGCCQAVVDVGRAVQADAGMAVFVVVQL